MYKGGAQATTTPPPSPQGKGNKGRSDMGGGMVKWWESLAPRCLPTSPPPPVLRCIHTQAKAFIGLWPCLVMAEYPIYNHRRTTVRITYAHSPGRILVLK